MSIAIETVKIGNIEMDYFRCGKEGGFPLAIIPGLSIKRVMESASAVAALYKPFADEFDIYVFDRRKNLPDTYSLEEMADDTAKAIEALGLTKVNFYGASQGAIMVQLIAIRHPELVNSIVLGSTAPRATKESEAIVKNWIDLATKDTCKDLMLAFADKVYTADFVNKYRDAFITMARLVSQEELDKFKILAGTLFGFDNTDKLGTIKCPALVLGARNDQVFNYTLSEELAKGIGCDVYIYDDYGHAVYDEAPDYVDRLHTFYKACVK